jgi:deoxyribose-phosphate aldolase
MTRDTKFDPQTLTRNPVAVAALIDHTLLKPQATQADVEALCHEALKYRFASVCVNPVYVPVAAAILHAASADQQRNATPQSSPLPEVKVCTVIGFPLGANHTSTKLAEARTALAQGATELDMVIHIGALKAAQDEIVSADVRAVCDAAHASNAICKVIIETCLLTEEEKVRACRLSATAGADFVKTSTGFSTAGATVEDVALMRTVVGPHIGVKASGGIRTLDDLLKMVQAGATRIGTSSGPKILQGIHP